MNGTFAAKVAKLRELEIHECPGLTPEGLAAIGNCPDLAYLVIDNCPLDSSVWSQFGQLPRLLQLNMTNMPDVSLTETGLDALDGMPSLHVLNLNETGVTDEQVAALARRPIAKQLTILHLYRSKVTEQGVHALRQALPQCSIEWSPAEQK